MRESYAKCLLDKNRQDYDKIAQVFDKKRDYIPPDFNILEKYVSAGEKILDLGCGNGRFKEVAANKADYFGADVSEKLISIAKNRYPDGKFFLTKPLNFPFENNFFDKIFCLAVFHHIPSKRFRKEFLGEIKRILKPGGKIILTVWDLRENRRAKQLLFKYTLLKLIGKSKVDFKDIFYPWKNSQQEILAYRYIHIFSEKELEKLVRAAGFAIKEKRILERSEYDKNIFLIAQKPEMPL